MDKYRYREYEPRYKRFFKLERDRLRHVLGAAVRIQHVGSMSVPGLGGKGILDVAIGVRAKQLADAKRELIERGYEFRAKASTRQRLFFRRDYRYRGSPRQVHIHLTEHQGKDWNEMVNFRDYLLRHPEAIQEYIEVKKKAVKMAQGKGDIYRKHKGRFINGILRNPKSVSCHC